MDTSTRLPGHGLLSEGQPYEWRQGDEEDAPSWHRTGRRAPAGHAVCSCGEASPEPLDTNGARQRWHRDVHKPAVRACAHEPSGTRLEAEADRESESHRERFHGGGACRCPPPPKPEPEAAYEGEPSY